MKVLALIALAGVVEALSGNRYGGRDGRRGSYYPAAPSYNRRGNGRLSAGRGSGYGYAPVRSNYGRGPAPRSYDRGYNRGRIGRGYNRGPVGRGYNSGPVGRGYNRGPVSRGYNRGYGGPRSYNRGYGRPQGYNRGYNRGHGGPRGYNRGPIARGYNRVYRSPRSDYRKPKTDRAYDAIEIFGDNGKDYGFGEQKLKTTYTPGAVKNSFTKTFSSTTYGGSKSSGPGDFNNVSKNVMNDSFGRNQGDQLKQIESMTDDFSEKMGLAIGRQLSGFGAISKIDSGKPGIGLSVTQNISDIESTLGEMGFGLDILNGD